MPLIQPSMAHLAATEGKRLLLASTEQKQDTSETVSGTASHASGSCCPQRHTKCFHRYSPYKRQQGSPSCSQSHQDTLLQPGTQQPSQGQHTQDQHQLTVSMALGALQQDTTLQQQSPDSLLDIAISLASRSLSRTVAAFQAACHCWAAGAEPALTNHALEVAETSMARTIRRMELAQQLAAAVFQKDAAGQTSLQPVEFLQQQQFQQLAELMAALQQNRQQQLLAALPVEDEEDGEEEVCSSWSPLAVSDC